MRTSSLTTTTLAVAALVLTVLVFVPINSQAETVILEGNTATGIEDLEIDGVLYDITFVYQTGNSLYGPRGEGDFPFEASNAEEQTFVASRAIQEALNAWPVAITRVGPQDSQYFYIGAGEENTDPGNTDTPWVYAAYESRYDVQSERRPPNVWTQADNFPPFPLGMAPPLEQDIPYSWAKVEYAGGSPPPDDVTVGGSVTGLTGSGLVMQNNGGDDESISDNGPFTFDTAVTPGSAYLVTVKTQPSNPAQSCTVAYGNGTVPGGGVDDTLVTCAAVPVPPSVPDTAFLTGGVYLLLLLDD